MSLIDDAKKIQHEAEYPCPRPDCASEIARLRARVEAAERLARHVQSVVPYVSATVAPASHREIEEGWIKVHRGRAFSSQNQLENLLSDVAAFDATAETEQDGTP